MPGFACRIVFTLIWMRVFARMCCSRATGGEILRQLRGSLKAPGEERIYTAGEKEYDVWMYRKDKGVPVTEAVQKEFIQVRDEYGLTQFRFPFE